MVYDLNYESVFRAALETMEESNFVIREENEQKGSILGERKGFSDCVGGIAIGIFLERIGPDKIKVEVQENMPCLSYLSQYKNIAAKISRKVKDRTIFEAKQKKIPSLSDELLTSASDVDDLTGIAKVAVRKHAYAVVIGIETYRGKIPRADFADRDAKVMGEYLTKVLGYPEENVVVLDNENATRTDMEKYIEGWLPNRIEKDASVFFYFSGHGTPNAKSGDAYLVPYDGDPAFVEKTGYPMQRLYEQLGKLPTKEVVVVLDTCFSGAGGRSVLAQGARPMVLSIENPILVGGKTVVLAAGSGDQISSTYRQKSHGLLTYFFLKGLQGEADRNKDGTIDLAELFEYVKPQVERVARREFNNDQIPQLLGSPEVLKRGIKLVEPPAR